MSKTQQKLSIENRLEIFYANIEELKANPRNAKTHPEKQLVKLARSIKSFGFNTPVLIDKRKTIIAGHGRVLAAQKAGLTEVPVITLDKLSNEDLRVFALADNKLAEESPWDMSILSQELQELIKIDLDFTTISGFEVPDIDIVINEDYADKNKNKKPDPADKLPEGSKIAQKVKSGDLWKLGDDHYLYCGDSREEKSFEILLGEKRANMILADDPYNVKINGNVCASGTHEEFAMASGEMSSEEFTNFLEIIFMNLAKYSIDGSLHFHFMDWRHLLEILTAGKKVYTELKNLCIWDKGIGGMGSLYRSQHECILLYKNGTAPHINNIELGSHGRYRTNIWSYRGVSATNPRSLEDLKLHPTVKPVALLADAILDCSRPGDIILDCFAGSGSTILAAERTKRKAYVIEYEPHYCDVTIYRYEKLFGKKAELVSNYSAKEVENA